MNVLILFKNAGKGGVIANTRTLALGLRAKG